MSRFIAWLTFFPALTNTRTRVRLHSPRTAGEAGGKDTTQPRSLQKPATTQTVSSAQTGSEETLRVERSEGGWRDSDARTRGHTRRRVLISMLPLDDAALHTHRHSSSSDNAGGTDFHCNSFALVSEWVLIRHCDQGEKMGCMARDFYDHFN